jgi:hypothetical protein
VIRYTTYRYSADRGLPCGWDSLLALGLAAARYARWAGIPEQKVAEGSLLVHTWPPEVFDYVIRSRRAAAGAMEIYRSLPDLPGGEAALDMVTGNGRYGSDESFPHGPGDLYDDEVIPPWCPLPAGDQALRDIGY